MTKIRKCEVCNNEFEVPYPSTKKRSCSHECKKVITRNNTLKQFEDDGARERHQQIALAHKQDSGYLKKYNKGMKNRRSYKGENHPSYGKERTPEWRENISKGNKGVNKGKTWEEIYGIEGAKLKRSQNSKFIRSLNETLLKDRKSSYENKLFEYLKPLGFIQNKKILKYNADFINEQTKTIIEFHGDFWHSNPKIYEDTFINPVTKIKACDKWIKDEQRKNDLENAGYEVLIWWESDITTEDAIKAAIDDYRKKTERIKYDST